MNMRSSVIGARIDTNIQIRYESGSPAVQAVVFADVSAIACGLAASDAPSRALSPAQSPAPSSAPSIVYVDADTYAVVRAVPQADLHAVSSANTLAVACIIVSAVEFADVSTTTYDPERAIYRAVVR